MKINHLFAEMGGEDPLPFRGEQQSSIMAAAVPQGHPEKNYLTMMHNGERFQAEIA